MESHDIALIAQDQFQAGADAEQRLVLAECLDMAAQAQDDQLLKDMLVEAVGNDEDFTAAFVAQCLDILEGPYPKGNYNVTTDFKAAIERVAINRFSDKALDRVRA